jgi:hypothetical protein
MARVMVEMGVLEALRDKVSEALQSKVAAERTTRLENVRDVLDALVEGEDPYSRL